MTIEAQEAQEAAKKLIDKNEALGIH